MSEELTVLKEYIDGFGVKPEDFTKEDLVKLSNELYDAGEYGLARLVADLSGAEELLEYVGTEEE